MYRHTVRCQSGGPLFSTWEEGARLWRQLTAGLPDLLALCVLPDCILLLHAEPVRDRLARVLSGYTRWRNVHHSADSALLGCNPRIEALNSALAQRDALQEVHLAPVRAGLVSDPIAWPLSTHLDALGLTWPAARPPIADRLAFHERVSSDPAVSVSGTPVPAPGPADQTLERVLDAVSLATRTPVEDVIGRRGAARTLFLAAARELTPASAPELAEFADLHVTTVRRSSDTHAPLERIAALAADERCVGLRRSTLQQALCRWRRVRARSPSSARVVSPEDAPEDA